MVFGFFGLNPKTIIDVLCELVSSMDSMDHLSERFLQDVPAGVVEVAGEPISPWSSVEIGCPYRLLDFSFSSSLLQKVIVLLCEHRLYLPEKFFLSSNAKCCRVEKKISYRIVKEVGTLSVTFNYVFTSV